MNEFDCYPLYEQLRDIWIPAAGAILIPVAIAFFTWFFGASRAEKQKELLRSKAALNYLKSVCCYTVVNLLTLRKAVKIRSDICAKFQTADDKERFTLFSVITFQDIYSQIDVEKYAEFTTLYPPFSIDLLQVKRSLKDVFETMELLNSSMSDLNKDNILSHLTALKVNLPCFMWKICFALNAVLKVMQDVEYAARKMKLKDIVTVAFSQEEQQQITEAKNELADYMKNSKDAENNDQD